MPLQQSFCNLPIRKKTNFNRSNFLRPAFQRSKPYHRKLFHRIHPSSLLSDRRPSRLECTARRCYTETHCLDKKSWALLKILFGWMEKNKKVDVQAKNSHSQRFRAEMGEWKGEKGYCKKFHSRTSIRFIRWMADLRQWLVSSSDPSLQSFSWSQCHRSGIQRPLLHRNWSWLHDFSAMKMTRKWN